MAKNLVIVDYHSAFCRLKCMFLSHVLGYRVFSKQKITLQRILKLRIIFVAELFIRFVD